MLQRIQILIKGHAVSGVSLNSNFYSKEIKIFKNLTPYQPFCFNTRINHLAASTLRLPSLLAEWNHKKALSIHVNNLYILMGLKTLSDPRMENLIFLHHMDSEQKVLFTQLNQQTWNTRI